MRGCLDVHVYEKYTLCILTITSINIIAVIQTYKNEYIYIYMCVCVCVYIIYIYIYLFANTPTQEHREVPRYRHQSSYV